MTGCRERANCVLCAAAALDVVLPLAPTPIADDYRKPGDDRPQPLYPLALALCRACGHVQLSHAVDPDLLFGAYTFRTASSLGLVKHLKTLAEAAAQRAGARAGLALDIGSNDGSLLRHLRDLGFTPLGVDPASAIAAEANAAGLETLPAFFGSALAAKLRRERGAFRVVTAANVFAHSDALADMADGVAALLDPAGVFVFEVSYLADTVEQLLFDTVYHEHISYHSLAPLVPFLAARGLSLFDVERIGAKGGSVRVFAAPASAKRPVTPAVGELLALEARLGLAKPPAFRDFNARIEKAKTGFRALLDGVKGPVAGYGANVTSTTLLYHFGLGERLDYLVDDNPLKQGTVSPGYRLPVSPSSALYERRPAAVAILAWKYAAPILERHARWRAEGGRFLLPLPEASEA